MNWRKRTGIIVLSFLSFLMFECGPEEKKQVIKSETNQNTDSMLFLSIDNYAPYIDKNLPHQGFLSHIVQESYRRVAIQTTLVYRPWKRVELEIDWKNSVSFSYISNKERSKKWFFSDQIIFCL